MTAPLARHRPHPVPGDVSRARSASASRAGRWPPACGRWRRATSGRRPPTATAASTTPRPAAGPAWCCGPTCWRPRSMPPMRPHRSLSPRLLMSPRGRPLTQSRVRELAGGPGALIVCGRFEGVDQRVIEARQLEEVSIGDYVLSGGEIAAMALIDACVRLLPGVMGKAESGAEESFSDALLEYPQYTRPQTFEGRPIPEILHLRRPRQGRGLAPGRGRGADPRPPARSMGRGRQRRPKKHDRRVTRRAFMPYRSAQFRK